MRNIKTSDKFSLSDLLSKMQTGAFVVPNFQRDYEWSPKDVRDLIHSIMKDNYIGSILLWEKTERNISYFKCTPLESLGSLDKSEYIVLDGQQRLTSLHYALFSPDIKFPKKASRAKFYCNILSIENNKEGAVDYVLKKHFSQFYSPEEEYAQHNFPVYMLSQGAFACIGWVDNYTKYWEAKNEELSTLIDKEKEISIINSHLQTIILFRKRLETLFSSYYIPYIELSKDLDIDRICDIFTQLNSKGKKLDIFDLMNARLTPHDIELKLMWANIKSSFIFSSVKKDHYLRQYILQAMSIKLQRYNSSSFLYNLIPGTEKQVKKEDGSFENIILVDTSKTFTREWESMASYMAQCQHKLMNTKEYGVVNQKYLPYLTILPIFTAIHEYVGNNEDIDPSQAYEKIKLWYWANMFLGRYSSSTETKAAKDYNDLKAWFDSDSLEPSIIADFTQSYRQDFIRFTSAGKATYKAVLNLLVINNASDLVTGELPDYSKVNDHHIVPQSWGKEHNLSHIDTILNRTLVTERTNKKYFHAKLPNEYIPMLFEQQGEERARRLLASHLISSKAISILLRTPFTPRDFDDFIKERQESLYNLLNDIVLKLPLGEEMTHTTSMIKNELDEIELSLRDLIAEVGDSNSSDPFKEIVSERTREKCNNTFIASQKKDPYLTDDSFKTYRQKLDYFTLGEYKELIDNKRQWPFYESILPVRSEFVKHFDNMTLLRNNVAHPKDLSKIIYHNGLASISYFSGLLKNLNVD